MGIDEADMKNKFQIRTLQYHAAGNARGNASNRHLSDLIRPIGTAGVVIGALAAVLHQDEIANYLVATGLLFHLTIWFESWWSTANTP
jgi:hypothetical protein